MNIAKLAVLISLMFTLALLGIAQKTSPGGHDVSLYESLPQAERIPFREGLERVLSLHKAGKWSELYDYVDTDVPMSKEQFIKENSGGSALVEFQPKVVTYIPPSDSWLVTGCAEFREPSGKVFFAFSSVRARHTDKGWRFRDVAIELLKDEPHGIRSCQI